MLNKNCVDSSIEHIILSPTVLLEALIHTLLRHIKTFAQNVPKSDTENFIWAAYFVGDENSFVDCTVAIFIWILSECHLIYINMLAIHSIVEMNDI